MHSFILGLSLNYVTYKKEFRPRIHGHGLKRTSSGCFSVSEETKLEVDTTSIILSYILGMQINNYLYTVNLQRTKPCKQKEKKNYPIKVKFFVEESLVFTFPYQTNGNHATDPRTVGHVIPGLYWKSTFDFNEIVNNYGLKQGAVCQIVEFFSQFSLKLYIQF